MITNVLEYFEESVNRFPDKTAVADVEHHYTYGELADLAKRLASCLLARFPARRRPIAVLIDRNAESLLAFTGILYSGNFYVPVAQSLPPKRIAMMMETLNPVCVVGPSNYLDQYREMGLRIPTLSLEEGILHPIHSAALAKVRRTHLDTDPLYAIFTSGSTGVPKSVAVCHRSVVDLVEQFASVFGFSHDEVFANQAPFDFDVSVKDIYNAWKCGGTMEIIPQSMFVMPKNLVSHMNERKVTTIIWAVSALNILYNFKVLDYEVPKYLNKIMFSGEVMPMKVLNYWKSILPDAMYVNLYGPTEITCNCTYYICDREFANTEVLPIGQAFPNTEILLLDESLKPVSAGETGEICVRGTCLALGYYNNAESTRQAFCQNPLNPWYPELIYRTGDMGRVGNDGLLYFAARKDAQIKHMGHRIELPEIEATANALEYIENCCCLYDKGTSRILFFYQAKEPCDSQILKDLMQYLPKFMCPNKLIHLTSMPMNKHGKIDRVLLRKTYIEEDKRL